MCDIPVNPPEYMAVKEMPLSNDAFPRFLQRLQGHFNVQGYRHRNGYMYEAHLNHSVVAVRDRGIPMQVYQYVSKLAAFPDWFNDVVMHQSKFRTMCDNNCLYWLPSFEYDFDLIEFRDGVVNLKLGSFCAVCPNRLLLTARSMCDF